MVLQQQQQQQQQTTSKRAQEWGGAGAGAGTQRQARTRSWEIERARRAVNPTHVIACRSNMTTCSPLLESKHEHMERQQTKITLSTHRHFAGCSPPISIT